MRAVLLLSLLGACGRLRFDDTSPEVGTATAPDSTGECGFGSYALSAAQIGAHFTAR